VCGDITILGATLPGIRGCGFEISPCMIKSLNLTMLTFYNMEFNHRMSPDVGLPGSTAI